VAACARSSAAPPPSGGPNIRIPIGDVDLDSDGDLERKLGGAFPLGMRGGATNCYVTALASDETRRGEIAFVARPPKGEGRYLVELQKSGPIGDDVVDCVRKVFDDFYHYEDKEPFETATGTLRFAPEWITAPAPPTPEAAKQLVEDGYARTKVVRMVRASLHWTTQGVDGEQILVNDFFDVALEFERDGYEVSCQHFGPYKLFTRAPYQAQGAGHTCESVVRKKGDRTTDTSTVMYSLRYNPQVADGWKVSGFDAKTPSDFDRYPSELPKSGGGGGGVAVDASEGAALCASAPLPPRPRRPRPPRRRRLFLTPPSPGAAPPLPLDGAAFGSLSAMGSPPAS
jgi:hypothetical protein